LRSCVAAIILSVALISGAAAAPQIASSEEATLPPNLHELVTLLADPKAHQLLTLLADPKIQQWLEAQGETKAVEKAAAGSLRETDPSAEEGLGNRWGSASAAAERIRLFIDPSQRSKRNPGAVPAPPRLDICAGVRAATWRKRQLDIPLFATVKAIEGGADARTSTLEAIIRAFRAVGSCFSPAVMPARAAQGCASRAISRARRLGVDPSAAQSRAPAVRVPRPHGDA
jgi:hypothetical protein